MKFDTAFAENVLEDTRRLAGDVLEDERSHTTRLATSPRAG